MAENHGFLTETDRELLAGKPGDVTERALEQRKIRLRNRIRQAVIDFETVYRELSPEDRHYVFQPGHRSDFSRRDIRGVLNRMVSFAYLGLRAGTDEEVARKNLEHAADAAEGKLQIESDAAEILEIYDRHKQGENLTKEEVDELIRGASADLISIDDLADTF